MPSNKSRSSTKNRYQISRNDIDYFYMSAIIDDFRQNLFEHDNSVQRFHSAFVLRLTFALHTG